jgi:hypothetical protein
VARLAISKDFLADYAKLDKDVQRAVDQAVATFARHPQPRLHLERPQHVGDDRLRILPVDTSWRGVVLTAGDTSPEDTYSLVTVLPQDQADAYVTSHRFSVNRALKIPEVRDEEAVSQLQPSFHATPEDERLPADVSREEALDEALAELAQVTLVSERQNPRFSLAHPFAAWRRFRTRTSAS